MFRFPQGGVPAVNLSTVKRGLINVFDCVRNVNNNYFLIINNVLFVLF